MQATGVSGSRASSAVLRLVHCILLIAVFLGFCAGLGAQESAPAVVAQRPLITAPIDETQLTTLKGNTHPLAKPIYDVGTAPGTLPMNRMLLVLKRSPEQEAALRKLLDDQQDKASPNYHKWLTPEQFGKQFGPSDDDMQKITAWLQSHGFQVGSTKGRTVLEFSGTAAQVQETFHAAIHKYVVNGEQHWANATDPQIPAALSVAVAGPMTLHNFLKKPLLHMSKEPVAAKLSGDKNRPEATFSDGSHALGPWDFATIYNSPLATGTTPDGSGVTIGIVGRSDLYSASGGSAGSDVSDFRTQLLGGTYSTTNFQIIYNGPDPGDSGGGEEAEATLDTTWSGAIAPNAAIDLVVSGSTNTTDGIDLSEVYIIENNLADIMSESFGSCESGQSGAEAGISALAEQAAAQGITYFVSTGDSGAEGCDDPNSETVASGPVSVNILASSPFNVAVGGTMFNEGSNPSSYWSSANNPNGSSVIKYIPEDVWNESCNSTNCPSGVSPNISAGSGGASTLVSKPSWQTGFPATADTSRDLPDVSLTAASHDPYLLCLEGSCVPNAQGQFLVYFVWGTSAAAPSFAAITALIDEQMNAMTPGDLRQGLANYELYNIASKETFANCNGSTGTFTGTCVFNDITSGNNAVPGEVNYGLTTAQYKAGPGYDLASGLGSVNVTNLIAAWPSASFPATTTTLTLNGGTIPVTINHGASVNVAITVSANSGNPAGDVALIAGTALTNSSTNQTGVAEFTLTPGTGSNPSTASGSTNQLPGGTYMVTAHYAGNGAFGSSDSTPGIQVTVSKENSTTTISNTDQNGNVIANGSTLPFGSLIFVRADVAPTTPAGPECQGPSYTSCPAGTVTFTDSFGAIPSSNPQVSPPVAVINNPSLNGQGNTSIGDGIISFDAGNHSITAVYSGDNSFNPSSASGPVTFTITPGFAIVSGFAPVMITAPGGSGTTTVGIVASSKFGTAITFTCSAGLPTGATCATASATSKGPTTVVNTTINITTTGPSAMLRTNQQRYYYAALLGGLPVVGIFFAGGVRRRRFSIGIGLVLLMALLVALPACGGGSSPSHQQVQSTPAGTYNVTITAAAGSLSQTGQFQLVVQ
jgi:hypothetical protein